MVEKLTISKWVNDSLEVGGALRYLQFAYVITKGRALSSDKSIMIQLTKELIFEENNMKEIKEVTEEFVLLQSL